MLSVLTYISLAILFLFFILFLSFGWKGKNYFSVDVFISEINQKFLVLPYIIAPAIYIFLVLYFLNASSIEFDGINNLWLVSLLVACIRFAAIIVTSRFERIPKKTWIIASVASVLISWHINSVVLQEFQYINGFGPIILLMLVVSVIGIHSMLATARFGDLDELASYEKFILDAYRRYTMKYKSLLGPQVKEGTLPFLIFFSIMIAEDINRPRAVRIIENVLARFHAVSTTGIMQVSADEVLSDAKSVALAKELISGSYRRHKKKLNDTYDLVRAVASDYNGDAYPDLVIDIYYIIKRSKNY